MIRFDELAKLLLVKIVDGKQIFSQFYKVEKDY